MTALELLNQFLVQLAVAVIPILAGFLAALLSVGVAWVVKKVQAAAGENTAALTARYMAIMEEEATNAIMAVQQTYVDALKRDGGWTKETADEAKRQAYTLAMASMLNLQKRIQDQIGIDVPAHMNLLIERLLRDMKNAGEIPTVNPVPAPPPQA